MIDLQYKGQIVAKIRGKEDIVADSLRTLEYIKALAANTSKQAGDSSRNLVQENDKNNTDISIILQSLERNEDSVQTKAASSVNPSVPEKKTAQGPAVAVKSKEAAKKQEVKVKQKAPEAVKDKKIKPVINQTANDKKEMKKSPPAPKKNDY
jgi:hypothetical protein